MYLDVEPVEGPGLGHEDPVDPLEDGELGPVPDHDHHLPLGVALVWSLAALLKKISFKKRQFAISKTKLALILNNICLLKVA